MRLAENRRKNEARKNTRNRTYSLDRHLFFVYLTLPQSGEQIYIPPAEHTLPSGVEIPEGYKLVDNYTDVYYSEQEDGIHYYWLVKFSDGTYGWQEVDKDGNIIFPNHSSEPEQTENTSDESSDEVTTESTDSETTQGE